MVLTASLVPQCEISLVSSSKHTEKLFPVFFFFFALMGLKRKKMVGIFVSEDECWCVRGRACAGPGREAERIGLSGGVIAGLECFWPETRGFQREALIPETGKVLQTIQQHMAPAG